MATKKSTKTIKDIVEDLAWDPVFEKGDLLPALQKIGKVGAEKVGADEVSFWQLSKVGDDLVRIAVHTAGGKTASTKTATPASIKQIPIKQVKSYLSSLQEAPCLVMDHSKPAPKTMKQAVEILLDEKTRASLHVPIYVNGALEGVTLFRSKKEIAWDLTDRVLACRLADLTADTLHEHSIALDEQYTHEIVGMIEHNLDYVLKELNLSHGLIRLDEVPITRGFSPETELEIASYYRKHRDSDHNTMVVPDISLSVVDSPRLVNVLKENGVRAFVAAPLVIDLDRLGCVLVASNSVKEWKQEEVGLVEMAANRISRIVGDFWTRQDNQMLSVLIKRFEFNARTLNRLMLFDEAIQSVGQTATDVLETNMAFIIVRNPDNSIICPFVNGLDPTAVKRIVETESLAMQDILHDGHMPVLFMDISKSILPKSLQRHLIDRNIRSSRIFPLVYEDQTLGAVLAFYARPRIFTRNERNMLSLFANTATLTLQNSWMYNQIEQGYLNLALALANILDAREATISDIGEQAAQLAAETARALKISEDDVETIRWAAMLHDIGKKDIPEEILQKTGPLTPDEWKKVHRSPEVGEHMLDPLPQLRGIAKIIRSYREHYDGSGYPDRLKGDQISVGAKVLAVADAYTSMIDHRSYREPFAPMEALEEIKQRAGTHFDPNVVNAFSSVAARAERWTR